MRNFEGESYTSCSNALCLYRCNCDEIYIVSVIAENFQDGTIFLLRDDDPVAFSIGYRAQIRLLQCFMGALDARALSGV